jgi:hypothetical protein
MGAARLLPSLIFSNVAEKDAYRSENANGMPTLNIITDLITADPDLRRDFTSLAASKGEKVPECRHRCHPHHQEYEF